MNSDSPKGLALIVSLIVAAIAVAIYTGYCFFNSGHIDWFASFVMSLVIAAVSFLVFSFVLERFINKKIKLIYKTIHNLKFTRNADLKADMRTDVLNEVNEEVIEWAEKNKQEVEALKTQEKFRREFIGNLSHEMKTPAFNIQGYLLTLLEGGLEDPSINRKYLEKAEKSTERLINIVNDLDTISGLEVGQLKPDLQRMDIVEVTKDVLDSFEMTTSKAKIKLTFNKSYDAPIWVMADRKGIRQVLVNLILNSINYGKENGTTEVRFYDMDERLLVEVADDGIGIAAKSLPRLFERFYRVDESRSRDKGGTGLGLAIVKHIMDAHRQTINVRSTEGIGSTFSFTLKKA